MLKGADGQPAPGLIRTVRRGSGQPGQPGDRDRTATCSTSTSTAGRSGASSTPPANQPPTAVATATPTTGAAPLTVNFDGTGSSDPDGRHPHLRLGPRRRRRLRRLHRVPADLHLHRRGSLHRLAQVTDSARRRPTPPRSRSPPATPRPRRPSTRRPPAPPGRSATSSASPARPPTRRTAPCPASALSWDLVLQHCPSNCHYAPAPDLRRRRQRLVRRARPRVPVAPGAAAHRDRLRRADRTPGRVRLDPADGGADLPDHPRGPASWRSTGPKGRRPSPGQ